MKTLHLGLIAAAVLAHTPALADPVEDFYKGKTFTFVSGYPPGGGVDVTARPIAAKLTERWGQSVIVDNRPGAGQMIGLELVAKSPADGYVLAVAATPLAANAAILDARKNNDGSTEFTRWPGPLTKFLMGEGSEAAVRSAASFPTAAMNARPRAA